MLAKNYYLRAIITYLVSLLLELLLYIIIIIIGSESNYKIIILLLQLKFKINNKI